MRTNTRDQAYDAAVWYVKYETRNISFANVAEGDAKPEAYFSGQQFVLNFKP